MGFKQKRGAAICAMGIGIFSLFEAGYSSNVREPEKPAAYSKKGPGPTAVATTVEILPTTTTTYPAETPTIYTVEPPRPMTEAEKQESYIIIENQIRQSLEKIGVPIVAPDETVAEVTALDEFIVPVGDCGAKISVNALDVVEAGTVRPSTAKKLALSLLGDLSKLANGENYTPDKFDKEIYPEFVHADPGIPGYEFDPNNPASVQLAVEDMLSTAKVICSNGTVPKNP